jgi:hypothetical protein
VLPCRGSIVEQLQACPVPSCSNSSATLADFEEFFADRILRTTVMDRPLLIRSGDFRYSDVLRYPDHDLEEELLLIEFTPRQMARVLRLLAPDAWQRRAVHSEAGLVTLRQQLLHSSNRVAFAAETCGALGM